MYFRLVCPIIIIIIIIIITIIYYYHRLLLLLLLFLCIFRFVSPVSCLLFSTAKYICTYKVLMLSSSYVIIFVIFGTFVVKCI